MSAPKNCLMLSVSEKEKLLNWDAVVATEVSTNSSSNSKEQVDVIKAALSAILVKIGLSQNVLLLFISVFLPCVVSFSGPKIVTKIRTSNSTLC